MTPSQDGDRAVRFRQFVDGVAQALVAGIKQAGGVATAVQADVSDPAAVKVMIDAADATMAASTVPIRAFKG